MQGWLSGFSLAAFPKFAALSSLAIASASAISTAPSLPQPPPFPAMKLLPILLAFLALTATSAAADSVTDELEKNGLPVGLLPNSVRSYSIGQDGHFTLSLAAPCYAKIDDQLVFYSQNITGKLKYGAISNLDGIQTKQLFVWLPVTGIYVDVPATPYIYFEVGVLTKRLAVAVFETPIKCSAHADTGFHLPSWVANGAVGGPRPRKALQ